MRKVELDRLLEKTVADALGLTLPPVANTHKHNTHGKPHRAYTPRHGKPIVHSRHAHPRHQKVAMPA